MGQRGSRPTVVCLVSWSVWLAVFHSKWFTTTFPYGEKRDKNFNGKRFLIKIKFLNVVKVIEHYLTTPENYSPPVPLSLIWHCPQLSYLMLFCNKLLALKGELLHLCCWIWWSLFYGDGYVKRLSISRVPDPFICSYRPSSSEFQDFFIFWSFNCCWHTSDYDEFLHTYDDGTAVMVIISYASMMFFFTSHTNDVCTILYY